MFYCIHSTNQTKKQPHLITSLKPILKAHKINLCKQKFERSLSKNRRLYPRTLKIGSDVALSFDFPNYENMGHQHAVSIPPPIEECPNKYFYLGQTLSF